MPSLGADMDAGTLLEWLVKPGDTVHRGDVIALVDTDKAAVDVECFEGGVVQRLLVRPGERVPVGTALAVIGAEAVAVPAAAAEPAAATEPVAPVMPATPARRVSSPPVRHLAAGLGVDLATVIGTGRGGVITRRDVERAAVVVQAVEPAVQPNGQPAGAGRRRASPLARRLAAELGVDLATIEGSGEAGAVRADDVRRAAHQAAQPEAPPTTRPPAQRSTAPAPQPAAQAPPTPAAVLPADHELSMRRAIAALMSRSNREIPHYYLTWTVDMTAATAWLREHNQAVPLADRLVPAALLLKAAARAARQVPELNGTWAGDRFEPAEAVHLGLIVSLRAGGITAPVIRDAADLGLVELMHRMRDLVERARRGRLRGSELGGATITVSNLGEHGAESVLGVIYPPQVALVGFGAMVTRPWAVDGLLGIRPLVTASLSADHRASDGATGSRYLRAIAKALQRPEEL